MEFLSALNILARLPPGEADTVVTGLSTICPKLKGFLISRVDARLQVLADESTGKLFVASDYNKVGHSYRSPWSNTYIPHRAFNEELYFPPDSLRKIEQNLNELLLTYCGLYYDNAVGSALFSETGESGVFYGAIFIVKEFSDSHLGEAHTWESVHSVQVTSNAEGDQLHVECAMTSSVLTIFDFNKSLACNMNGSVRKSSTKSWTVYLKSGVGSDFDESVVRSIGELVEEHENALRGTIDKVAIPRCIELALASFGAPEEDTVVISSGGSSDEDDYRQARVSLGTMNPLHRQSGSRPVPAFQADLMGAVAQRRKTQGRQDD